MWHRFFIIIAAIAIWQFYEANEAKESEIKERIKAEKNLENYLKKQLESVRERYKKHLEVGKKYVAQSQFEKAIEAYNKAIESAHSYAIELENSLAFELIDIGAQRAIALKQEAQEKLSKKDEFEHFMANGERLFNKGAIHFVNAKKNFRPPIT